MSQSKHGDGRSGRRHGFSTGYASTYTYGESCGTSEAEGLSEVRTGLKARAHAALVVHEIAPMIERLAGEVPARDFVWARQAVDSLFDAILSGRAPE